jgi:cell filamentation protein
LHRKDRYDIAGLDESQFEPGSRRCVLKNLLGITSKREMDQLEGREQVRSLEDVAAFYDHNHRFTAADVCVFTKSGWAESIPGQATTGR